MANWPPVSDGEPLRRGLVPTDQTGNDAPGESRWDGIAADTWDVTIPSLEVRSMRVDQIRREIAEGSYEVPGEAVADAIIRFFSRD